MFYKILSQFQNFFKNNFEKPQFFRTLPPTVIEISDSDSDTESTISYNSDPTISSSQHETATEKNAETPETDNTSLAEEKSLFQCTHCFRTFGNPGNKRTHEKACAKKTPKERSQIKKWSQWHEGRPSGTTFVATDTIHKCKKCSETFNRRAAPELQNVKFFKVIFLIMLKILIFSITKFYKIKKFI